MYEAKTKLSEIVDAVLHGKEITLMNRGKPVAKVVPIKEEVKERKFGAFEGRIVFKKNWDAPIDDFKEYLK